jgi:hypothetical protein
MNFDVEVVIPEDGKLKPACNIQLASSREFIVRGIGIKLNKLNNKILYFETKIIAFNITP